MRARFRRLADEAAQAGVPEANAFFRMTPREIFRSLTAFRARQEAWWTRAVILSRLTALAVHDPARLPSPPAPRLPEMTADQIKQRLLAWRRKDDTP